MKNRIKTALLLLAPALSLAQVPVDDDGNVIGDYQSQAEVMPIVDDGIPLLSYAELQELVGPIALYPDDLLAIVLPASAYPLQIVEAARFLDALETDSSLEPDPDWDDSIVALTNYPEVVDLLNEDLDWTLRLGEAVVAQQTDVVAAVEAFRDRAYAAGNLESDSYQTVSREDDVIRISPVSEDVIYVPYYEPAQVVYYQPRPVYYYHPRPYPVYYYPYSAGYHFNRGYFWGVTTAFTIGWLSDSLHVYHHSYHGHPYYGRTYWNDGWYRRPSIHVYNTTYVNNRHVNVNRHSRGDQWRARDTRREYIRREGYSRATARADRNEVSNERQRTPRQTQNISFRERDPQVAQRARETQARNTARQTPRQDRSSLTTRETTRDARREQPMAGTRNTTQRRGQSADRTRQDAAQQRGQRSNAQPATRTTRAPTRTEQPVVRTQRAPTRTEQPAVRTQRAPTRTERPAVRTQRAPTRTAERPAVRTERAQTTRRQSAPVQQTRRSEAPRQQQPRQQQPTRSRESSSSSPSRSQSEARSSQRSAERSSRTRDRKER